jgi:hypothetical protein
VNDLSKISFFRWNGQHFQIWREADTWYFNGVGRSDMFKVTAEPIPSWLEGAMKRKLAEALKRAKASDKRGYP